LADEEIRPLLILLTVAQQHRERMCRAIW
jgi:hypothetical protein